MSSVCPSYHRIATLSLAVFMALVAPMTVNAAQYSQSYDFNTEEFKDDWEMAINLEPSQISFNNMSVRQNFQSVTEYVRNGTSIFF